MQHTEKITALFFMLIIVFVAGLTGVGWFITVAALATLGFFFYDTWGVGEWKVTDMVNILAVALAIIIFMLLGGFTPSDEANNSTGGGTTPTSAPKN